MPVAAPAGDVTPADRLFLQGMCKYYGWGTDADGGHIALFRAAADLGHVPAMIELAICYSWGNGVEKDAEEVTRWYRLAAERGSTFAAMRLAARMTKESDAEAEKWYRFAAERGVVEAMHQLSRYTNNDERYQWCYKAAEQNYAPAMCDVGVMLARGEGTEKNMMSAVHWLEKAAEAGNAEAKDRLDALSE